jgi:hypothetical protein
MKSLTFLQMPCVRDGSSAALKAAACKAERK